MCLPKVPCCQILQVFPLDSSLSLFWPSMLKLYCCEVGDNKWNNSCCATMPHFSSCVCPCILFHTTFKIQICFAQFLHFTLLLLNKCPLGALLTLHLPPVFIGFYRPFPHSPVMVCVIKIACLGICCIFHMAFIHPL